VSQSVELLGSFPRAWPGPGTRCAEFGNFVIIWGDSSARSSLRPEIDRSQVASRPVDRGVELGAPGERYLSHGQGLVLPQYNGRMSSPKAAMMREREFIFP